MRLTCIVAMSENRVIGRQNALPWHLSADLKRFKQLTVGHTIIMGRKTWESIGRPLPQRRSIVLSTVVGSLEQALAACQGEEEAFVIGGRALFEESLPRAERLYLTLVRAVVEGDVYFPTENLNDWRVLTEEEGHPADEKNDYPHTFRVYERRQN
jgi:dihydrofolate reductase